MLTLSRRHLHVTLGAYVEHYNLHRSHCSLGMDAPAPRQPLCPVGNDPPLLERREVLGGLIHEYDIAA